MIFCGKVRRFNLTSDIFFGKVMESVPACQEFICILTKENFKIKKVQTQYSIRNVESHSVILDVLAEDESGKLVNVEDREQQNLLRYMKHTDREHESEAFPELAGRVNLLKEKKEGVEIMCEILEQERAEGKAEGRCEGRREGRREGRQEGIELARNVFHLLRQGIPAEEIAERLEISAEVVKRLTE